MQASAVTASTAEPVSSLSAKTRSDHRAFVSLMLKANTVYGLLGFFWLFSRGAQGSWKSFLAGWIVSIVNFELLRRIGSMLLVALDGGKPNAMLYTLLFLKFIFWGGVISFLMSIDWMNGVPFVFGTLTILAGGLVLSLKEVFYARRT